MVEFRHSLAASFLFKFLVWAAQRLEEDAPGYLAPFPQSYMSGGWQRAQQRAYARTCSERGQPAAAGV